MFFSVSLALNWLYSMIGQLKIGFYLLNILLLLWLLWWISCFQFTSVAWFRRGENFSWTGFCYFNSGLVHSRIVLNGLLRVETLLYLFVIVQFLFPLILGNIFFCSVWTFRWPPVNLGKGCFTARDRVEVESMKR